MNRRDLLKQIALLTGGAVIGGELFLTGCKTGAKMDAGFTPVTIAMLDEVGETIIPATSTPGAKAAQIGEFMKTMVTDCYTAAEQTAFTEGIVKLNDACKKMHGKDFVECTPQQRKELLVSLEKEAKNFNDKVNKENEAASKQDPNNPNLVRKPIHYYTMMKQLTLFGFFTSKTGMTETLRYIPVPGKYDGAFPYKKGDKAWAESGC